MDLVSNVREGLRQRMDEVDWLDDDTRKLAIDKVNSIITKCSSKMYGMYT